MFMTSQHIKQTMQRTRFRKADQLDLRKKMWQMNALVHLP